MSRRERHSHIALFDPRSRARGVTCVATRCCRKKVPATGLVILRDGDPGEPDVTLNPRTEFYAHRIEIEV